jgi:hypothetical protein
MLNTLGDPAATKLYYTCEGVWTEFTDKSSIKSACMAENIAPFSQAESTPSMMEPLVTDLGYLANTAAAQHLDSTYLILANLDLYSAMLVHELWMPESKRDSPLLSSPVETSDHLSGWNKQKETIYTDPDGLTFCHYKAGASDDLISQVDATLQSFPINMASLQRLGFQ